MTGGGAEKAPPPMGLGLRHSLVVDAAFQILGGDMKLVASSGNSRDFFFSSYPALANKWFQRELCQQLYVIIEVNWIYFSLYLQF